MVKQKKQIIAKIFMGVLALLVLTSYSHAYICMNYAESAYEDPSQAGTASIASVR